MRFASWTNEIFVTPSAESQHLLTSIEFAAKLCTMSSGKTYKSGFSFYIDSFYLDLANSKTIYILELIYSTLKCQGRNRQVISISRNMF